MASDFDDEIALRCAEIKAAGGSPVIHMTKGKDGVITRVSVVDGSRPRPKRSSNKIPGWDCPGGHCINPGCTTKTHGRHSDEWIYLITSADKETVGTLTVNSFQYPHGGPEVPQREPYARDITLHVGFNYRDSDGTLHEATRTKCCWRDNQPCNSERTYALGASYVWNMGNQKSFEQGEIFWQAFEKWFTKVDAEVRAGRSVTMTDTCPHCAGSGRVNQLAALGEALGVVGMVASTGEVYRRSRPVLQLRVALESILHACTDPSCGSAGPLCRRCELVCAALEESEGG